MGQSNSNSNSHSDRIYRIVVMGDPSVGKTTFLSHFRPVQDSTRKYVTDLGRRKIMISEVSTIEEIDSESIDGCIVMYDITNAKSYHNLSTYCKWLEHQREFSSCQGLLLGNKADIPVHTGGTRQVALSDGKTVADRYRMLFLEEDFECTCCVRDALHQLVTKIIAST